MKMSTLIPDLLVILMCLQNKYVWSQVTTKRVLMDIPETCSQTSTSTLFVEDKTAFVIQAKSGRDNPTVKKCEVVLGPYNDNRSLNVTFHSFYILESACGASLTIIQGKSSVLENPITLMTLDCTNKKKPNELSFIAERNVYLKFAFIHNLENRNYNFKINVVAGPPKVVETGGLSLGITVGIIVISIVAVILMSYLVYKTVRVKMSMREFEDTENTTSLYDLSNNHASQPHQNSYVPMPTHEQIEQITRREPDPEIYFEYNPSAQSRVSDKSSPEPDSPPPYEEALTMPLSASPEDQYSVEYSNVNHR